MCALLEYLVEHKPVCTVRISCRKPARVIWYACTVRKSCRKPGRVTRHAYTVKKLCRKPGRVIRYACTVRISCRKPHREIRCMYTLHSTCLLIKIPWQLLKCKIVSTSVGGEILVTLLQKLRYDKKLFLSS